MSRDMMSMLARMLEENGDAEKKQANVPSFRTEEDALAYATRLAQLKPGDTVLFGHVGGELKAAVFHGMTSDGKQAFVLYMDDENEISYAACPLGALWFPDMVATA